MSAFAFSAVYILIYLFTITWSVLSYIFHGLGLSSMARLRGMKAPWLAWIPGANMWLMGSIADHYDNVRTGRNKQLRKVYIGCTIAAIALTTVAVIIYSAVTIGSAVADTANAESVIFTATLIYCIVIIALFIPAMIVEYIIYYKICASCAPNRAKGLLVLSIFFPVIMPFVIYALRNRTEGLVQEQIS